MTEQRQQDPVSIIDGLAHQLVDARAEEAALAASLDEVRAHIAELEEQRDELRERIVASSPLTAERVRDVMRRFERMTFSELVAELERPPADVRRVFKPMLLGGIIIEAGRFGRAPIYEWVGRPVETTDPSRHPTKRPPEKEPPAGTESRATGEPVRVAAQRKLTRRGRSTPGTSHKHKQRDARYDRQQAAKEERAEANRSKAQKDPKWKRKR